jgi:hypothetical protein
LRDGGICVIASSSDRRPESGHRADAGRHADRDALQSDRGVSTGAARARVAR